MNCPKFQGGTTMLDTQLGGADRNVAASSCVSLNLITMGPDTKCLNGFTVSENESTGKPLQQMLTSANAPVSWFAARRGPALAKRVRA